MSDPRHGARREWWDAFFVFAFLMLMWSLATPLYASPDEGDHVIRAASVARGEVLGEKRSSLDGYFRVVEVPRGIDLRVPCYAHKPSRTPECVGALPSGSGTVHAKTAVGLDPPAFYAVVGLPSLLSGSTTGVHLMRVISMLICAALLASALLTLRSAVPGRLAALGLAFALTPMTVFLSSTVNPNGVETCAAIGAWASAAVLAYGAARGIDPLVVRRAGIAMLVLVVSRGLSPLWLAILVVTCLALATKDGLRALLASPTVRRWGIAVIAVTGLAGLWTLIVDPLGELYPHGPDPGSASVFTLFQRSFGTSYDQYRMIVGLLGWMDTEVPNLTHILWTVGLAVLVVLAGAFARRRHATIVVGLLVLTVVLPVVIDVSRARDLGIGWQGRWTLPLAVGVPILAGLSVAWNARGAVLDRSRLVVILAVCFVVAQFLAFAQALRRYTVGAKGSLTFWLHPSWSPPLPPIVLLFGAFVVLIGLAAWICRPGAVATPTTAEMRTVAVG